MHSDIKKLSDAHGWIMRMMALGYSNREIAEHTGYNAEYISKLSTGKLFQSELDKIRTQLREKFMTEAVDRLLAETNASLTKLTEIRDDPNASKSLQLRATVEVLDRNPVTAKWHKGAQHTSQSQVLSDEQIELLTQTFTMDPTAQLALAQARSIIDNAFDDDDDTLSNTPSNPEASTSTDANSNSNSNSNSNANGNGNDCENDCENDCGATLHEQLGGEPDYTKNHDPNLEI